ARRGKPEALALHVQLAADCLDGGGDGQLLFRLFPGDRGGVVFCPGLLPDQVRGGLGGGWVLGARLYLFIRCLVVAEGCVTVRPGGACPPAPQCGECVRCRGWFPAAPATAPAWPPTTPWE